MSELTRDQIEERRRWIEATTVNPEYATVLCDMALRTLDAEDRAQAAQDNWDREVEHLSERAEKDEARIRELEAALRYLYTEAQNESAANGWVTMYSAMVEAHKTLAATPPPDSEPAESSGGNEHWQEDAMSVLPIDRRELYDTPPERRDALEEAAMTALQHLHWAACRKAPCMDEDTAKVLSSQVRRALSHTSDEGTGCVVPEAVKRLPGVMGGRIQSRIQEWRAESWKAEAKRLRTQLDQERQRRERAEGLLRKAKFEIGGDVECGPDPENAQGALADRIDKHFGEWDG